MLKKLDIFLGGVGRYKGLTDNSRKVKKGFIFVAVKGLHFDGHDFVDEAVEKGAACVVGERNDQDLNIKKGTTYVKVEDSRVALGRIASAFYGHPSGKLKVIGVTGTDGKTTTSHLIDHLLAQAGKKVGLISTLLAKIGDRQYETGLHVTSPDSVALQKFLAEMVKEGCEYAVVEVTSHGIDQKRIEATKFDVGVITNITPEHLDYHQTLEAYRKTKLSFLQTAKGFVVLNRDDASFGYLKSKLKDKKIVVYERSKEVAGILPGAYNESNLAAALAVIENLGINKKEALKTLHSFELPTGRLQKVDLGQPFDIYIDFAHTPNALENVLSFLREKTKGRLIAVFGCAGERDTTKRPKMAEISTRLADFSIFTAEDPRNEKIEDILAQMERGVKNPQAKYVKIRERGEAISYAINKIAQKGDTVVICGKGHEKSMAYGHTEYPWSDYEAVKAAFKKYVHFMGIGGSGIGGVADLARKFGYQVSGCDLETSGHNVKHLKNVNLVVATPAVFFQSADNSEVIEAKKRGILMTWQEFLGKYLHQGKKVICITGTHGKSTTTAMVGKLLEDAGLDPLVSLGAKVEKWGGSTRFGKGKYFVTEADEFFDNFLNYHPEIMIINNIEFDHPDYFEDEESVLTSFRKFVGNLTGEKALIVNEDDPGVKKLLEGLDLNNVKLIKYHPRKDKLGFDLKVPGKHNVANALGVVALGKYLGINDPLVEKSLATFVGVGRRMELIGENKGIRIYDDYAHHPTAIAATLAGLREIYPNKRIWAIVEAHGFKRTKALINKYQGVFDKADMVVIGPIFKARDPETFGMTEKLIAQASKHKKALAFSKLDEMFDYLKKNLVSGDIVLVMGAGKSNLWTQKLLRK